MKRQSGFTLIELIVVIVILGILAAFALPKFVDLQEDARRSTVHGLKGSLHGAAAMAHGKALVNSSVRNNTNWTLNLNDGTSVNMNGTWPEPSSDGIVSMIQDLSGFHHGSCTNLGIDDAFNATNTCYAFVPNGASSNASCFVGYGFNGSGGNVYPVYGNNTSDCS